MKRLILTHELFILIYAEWELIADIINNTMFASKFYYICRIHVWFRMHSLCYVHFEMRREQSFINAMAHYEVTIKTSTD